MHTRWGTDAIKWANAEKDKARAKRIMDAALLLEEPRIENRHLDRRNWDERWLRLSASTHLLGELSKGPELTGRFVAMNALTLVGGRVIAGLIARKEAAHLLDAARAILGSRDYDDAWNLVERCVKYGPPAADTEWRIMHGFAQQWLMILDREKGEEVPPEIMVMIMSPGKPEKQEKQEPGEQESAPAKQGDSEQDSDGDGSDGDGSDGDDSEQDSDGDGDEEEVKPAEGEAVTAALVILMTAAGEMEEELEGGGGWKPYEMGTRTGFEPKWEPATPDQARGAEALRLRLLEWFMPERSVARVDQVMPPGRLNGRMAVKRLGEIHAGTIPTATPWRHVARRMVPTPPLRAGMVVDVSGSMSPLAAASREIAYRFSTAMSALPDARFRGMLAGEGTALLQSKPRQIPHYEYSHGHERVDLAAADLVERLALLRRGTARLLIIISDGEFRSDEEEGTITAMRQVIKAGGRVLWINFPARERHWLSEREKAERAGPPSCVRAVPGVEYLVVPANPVDAVRKAEEALIEVMKAGAVTALAARRQEA